MAEKFVKNIPEQKLKAFSIGSMGKRNLSKKELEEIRKKEQEEAAAHVFQEFVETFQESPMNGSKVWVKAGTYDAGARREDTKDKGKLYKPQSRISTSQESFSSAERAQEYARLLASDRKPERLGKKKEKGKSNLESFKEELRMIQEEREERHKYKGALSKVPLESDIDLFIKSENGSFDNGDPTTTNLYLGNLNPKITEQQLMEVFGKFGPLASIKIMWPRSDEEKARGRNCGFVAFMNRKDGERALKNLNGKDVMMYEMKLGWGKSVIIPPHPIYIPPTLLELSLPPPPSGLPFNAQPQAKDKNTHPQTAEELEQILNQAVVKVVIPTDRNLLMLIHRMVEFVAREGPLFEAMIMNRELNSPLFRFLFENQSPAHIYYRWKLFSVMQGDSQKEWRTKEFRMFKCGSIWKPPIMNIYTQGMPTELITDDDGKEPIKGSLSITQRDRLEDIIRNLTPERRKIGEAMVFCIDHSDAADEVAECLTESLTNATTAVRKKIARIYLVSDILHNCGVKVNNASNYRKAFDFRLYDIMKSLNETYMSLEGRFKAEGFKVRVIKVLKAWEDSVIYPRDFIHTLHNTFLGIENNDEPSDNEQEGGVPLEDEDDDNADGVPMDGAALLKTYKQNLRSESPNVDGVPLSGDLFDEDSALANVSSQCGDAAIADASSAFVPSKWETVDPDQIEAQAMTTSKWDQLDNSLDTPESHGDALDSNSNDQQEDSRNMTEERRSKLREIEVKAVQYQDEIESGVRTLKTGWTVAQQVEHYRRKLLRKSDKEKQKEISKSEKQKRDWERSDRSRRSSSGDEVNSYYKEISTSKKPKKRSKSSSGSPTPHRSKHRSRSRSPAGRKAHRPSSSTSSSQQQQHSAPTGKRFRGISPPSPPRISKHTYSPSSSGGGSSSSKKRTTSPQQHSSSSSYSGGKYYSWKHRSLSPSSRSSKYARRSPSPPPPPPPSASKHRRPSPPSPRYSRGQQASPEVSRKHRHKHKY